MKIKKKLATEVTKDTFTELCQKHNQYSLFLKKHNILQLTKL